MNMKIYIKSFIVLLSIFSFWSCNSQLDLDNDGHTNMNQVWTDRNSTMGYLNSCYNYRNGMGLDIASLTDESVDSRVINAGSAYQYWYNSGLTVDNYASYSSDGQPWSQFFNGIRKCNVFLANIPTAKAFCTDDERAGWTAQAYVLRAYYYLQLFKRYGQVPLILKDLGTNNDYSKATKAKVGDVVKQILSDCDAALATPDTEQGFSWNIYTNQTGIMTRAVAYAIESEAITFAVSPLFDDGTYTWADALNVTKNALYQCLTHDYSLWNTVIDGAPNAYASYFLSTPYDQRNTDKETIYAVDGRLSVWQWFGLPTNDGVTQAGICPTQELVDAYNMVNGEQPITGYTDAEHLHPIINPSAHYDESNPYANRDPRFYASIYYNGALRYLDQPSGRVVQTYETGNEGIDKNSASVKYTPTGYYLRKFNHFRSSKTSNYDGYNRLFRLADLYMNFAEAAYEVGTPDAEVSIGGSMTLSARDAVNKIRERAGLPDLSTGMSKGDFEKRFRNERFVEFAFEGKRFFDVRRWKTLKENFQYMTGMDITLNGNKYTYTRFKFSPRVTVDDKYLLYPLERNEANKMQTLTGNNWQNPGWK